METSFLHEILKTDEKYNKRQELLNTENVSLDKLGKTISGQGFILGDFSKVCSNTYSFKKYAFKGFSFLDCNEEFHRFLRYTRWLPKDVRNELNQLLYPMFVCIYLTLLVANRANEAMKFYSCYARLFLNFSGYSDKIKGLSQLKTSNDIYRDAYFRLFWQKSYIIQLSEENLEKLKAFLRDVDSRVFLPLLRAHFLIRDPEQHNFEDLLLDFQNVDDNYNQSKKSTGALNKEEAREPEILKVVQPATKSNPSAQSELTAGERITFQSDESVAKSTGNPQGETEPRKVIALESDHSAAKPNETSKGETVVEENVAIKNNLSTENPNLKCESEAGKLKIFNDISRRIFEGPLNPPAIYVHFIENKGQSFTSAILNKENSYASCGYEDSTICVWNLLDDLLKEEEEEEEKEENKESVLLKGHSGSVYGLSFIPSKDLLVSCSEDTTVRLWNLETCKNIALYYGHLSLIWDIDLSPTCSLFATSSADFTSCLWSFDRALPVRIFVGHESDVSRVKFHPNEHYIATASADGKVLLWTVMDAVPVRCLGGQLFGVSSIVFSNDGKYLASGDNGGNIAIWDIASGLELKTFQGHTSRILDLHFNRSDSVLVSCSLDETVKLWDVRSTINEKRLSDSSEYLSMVAEKKLRAIPKFLQYDENQRLIVLAGVNSKEPNSCSFYL